jgi:hypothetical protein
MDNKKNIPILPILIIYTCAAICLTIGKQIFLPSEPAPLPIYRISWPLFGALIESINLFPTLLFSAIAASFAFFIVEGQNTSRFSPQFLAEMVKPLSIIIAATALYGIFLLLFQPILFDARYRMQAQGQLFKDAREKAADEILREDWQEAAIHLAICERIWKQSDGPEGTQALRDKLAVALDKERSKIIDIEHPQPEKGYIETPEGTIPILSGQRGPVTIREALNLAERNLEQNNAFDAHWYASLAKKLAKPGSPEEQEATNLAAKAWNAISELKPLPKEQQAYRIYKEKLDGYNAILSGDYIRAYYIFNGLTKEVPSDPDVKKYLETALAGTKKIAFFQHEVSAAVGENLSYGIFTIPIRDTQGGNLGLGILKIDSLTMFSDVSFGTKVQYQIINNDGQIVSTVLSAYAKLSPFSEQTNGEIKNKTLVLLKAIDKNNKNRYWEPQWSGPSVTKTTYLVLDISYEDFLLACHTQTNSRNLSILELFKAQERLASFGYIPQTFQLELLNRIMDPFLCLVLGLFILTISWRLRPQKKPGLIAFPMFIILPLVAYLLLEGIRISGTIINTALLLNFSFPMTIIICVINELILLFLAVLFLAGQRS